MGVFIYLDDVDRHYTVAKAAGAEIVHPPKDVEYGRNYSAVDPEGHPWFFTTPGSAVSCDAMRPLCDRQTLICAGGAYACSGRTPPRVPAALCAAAKKPSPGRGASGRGSRGGIRQGDVQNRRPVKIAFIPLKVLHYATADVLIVQAGEPGHACHGCAAPLSAYVLAAGRWRPQDSSRAFHKFAVARDVWRRWTTFP